MAGLDWPLLGSDESLCFAPSCDSSGLGLGYSGRKGLHFVEINLHAALSRKVG